MSNLERPSSWQLILAGATAGGAESLVTYPTEYVKTRQQLLNQKSSPLNLLTSTIRKHGLRGIYTGAGVFCLSNSSKSAVRFFSFNITRDSISNHTGISRSSPLTSMLAGLCAGTIESVTVLTPGENLKTRLIDSHGGSKSVMRTVSAIFATDGPRGLYHGLVPVTMKQSSNAVVRFTCYQLFLDSVNTFTKDQTGLWSSTSPAIAGALAGVVTVYATMPFDNIKTKLQSVGGKEAYQSSMDCARKIVGNEGIGAMWKGTTPRLLRLSVSGALSFSIFEAMIKWTQSIKAANSQLSNVNSILKY